MRPRHPALRRTAQRLPEAWLMTDERMGDRLLAAVRRLPRGKAGIVFRHYHTPSPRRRQLYVAVRAIARRRRLLLILADAPRVARAWQADGWHGKTPHQGAPLLHSMAAHNRRELVVAIQAHADLVFLSPVFATRSHPGAPMLGPLRFGLTAQCAGVPIIALGGMTSRSYRRLKPLGADGYAAIDAWL